MLHAALLPLTLLAAQPTLFTCMTRTSNYVVGAKLPASGLFVRDASGVWQHLGYNHPFLFALDYDTADPSTIYLAAGNGLIEASGRGQKWKILTGSDVTELRDVAVDRHAPGTIYFAHSHGIRVSRDRGVTWQEIGGGLHRKFAEALRVDRSRAGVLLVGGEEGVFRSEDAGKTWTLAGAAGFEITDIEQSPHDACRWFAATQSGGLFGSDDCGRTFENTGGRIGVGSNLYDVAFDPSTPGRIAVVGWGAGVMISEDGGKSWQARNSGLPATHAMSAVFDPSKPGRLYVSVHDAAVFVSDDAGKTWTKDGLEGSVATRLRFIP